MNFGGRIAVLDILESLRCKGVKIIPKKTNSKKHEAINNWLLHNFDCFISTYKEKHSDTQHPEGNIPKLIWICWWDGIDTMPPLVSACYNSVLRNATDFSITLITKYNISEYISIPDHIMNKIETKKMTITHFSNIIRMSLLSKYGGLWIDATVLVTGPIKLNGSFFTIHREFSSESVYVSRQRWTGNLIGGMPNFVFFDFVREFLCKYWGKYDMLIDYFLYDYSIMVAYTVFSEIKETIDNVPFNNRNYSLLHDYLGKEYDPYIFNTICEGTVFHKLVWNKTFPVKNTKNNFTFYGYILEQYNG